MKAPVIAMMLSLGLCAPALGATFVYVSNAEDGDIAAYTLQGDGSLKSGERYKAEKLVMPMARLASDHSPTTHSGITNVGRAPARTRASVKAPMNFWPSLEPWLKAIKAAEAICNQRKTRRTFPGVALRQSQ